jgi:hypothetical protein
MLTDRITLASSADPTLSSPAPAAGPEDILASALGVIFPDDITDQHGDADSGVVYTSPLARVGRVFLRLAVPQGDSDRRLFSHYVWNAGVQMAALLELGRCGAGPSPASPSWSSALAPASLASLPRSSALAVSSSLTTRPRPCWRTWPRTSSGTSRLRCAVGAGSSATRGGSFLRRRLPIHHRLHHHHHHHHHLHHHHHHHLHLQPPLPTTTQTQTQTHSPSRATTAAPSRAS